MTPRLFHWHLLPPLAFALAYMGVILIERDGIRPLGESLNYFVPAVGLCVTPHLVWAGLAALFEVRRAVAHSGFAASSIALLPLAWVALQMREPSATVPGWAPYWPLFAIILQILVACITALVLNARERTLQQSRA